MWEGLTRCSRKYFNLKWQLTGLGNSINAKNRTPDSATPGFCFITWFKRTRLNQVNT